MRSKKDYPTKRYIRGLIWVFFLLFSWFFRIKKKMPTEVKKLKPPYLVLGNHVGFWDPFITGNALPHYIHFVSSDAAFRSPVFRFFLTNLGSIPKKKNIRDTKVIRDIIAVIRQGENIGIFPEAVRSWAGSSFPIDPSIAKLISLLKVPVLVPVLKGMNLFNPRWSVKMRRTRVLIDYSLLFTATQVKELSEKEIFVLLVKALSHDEVEYQRKAMVPIRSKIRAEHISHALYVCPDCKSIDSFRCGGNDFRCEKCGYDIHINRFGFFERLTEGKLHYDNIRDWYSWEEKFLSDLVAEKFKERSQEVIFKDQGSKIYHSATNINIKFKGEADVLLYTDRLVIRYHDLPEEVLNFVDLQTINPQVYERLEIFYNNQAYRVVGGRPGVSALKWEVAVNTIWKKLGQQAKLSPYINC